MGITVTIRDETAPGKSAGEIILEDIPRRITLRDLIRMRVQEEVARHNAKKLRLASPLVQPVEAEIALNGPRSQDVKRIDWRKQMEVAEDAFLRNRFFVLVGGRQVADLDEELMLNADTDVKFVRLMPLVGG